MPDAVPAGKYNGRMFDVEIDTDGEFAYVIPKGKTVPKDAYPVAGDVCPLLQSDYPELTDGTQPRKVDDAARRLLRDIDRYCGADYTDIRNGKLVSPAEQYAKFMACHFVSWCEENGLSSRLMGNNNLIGLIGLYVGAITGKPVRLFLVYRKGNAMGCKGQLLLPEDPKISLLDRTIEGDPLDMFSKDDSWLRYAIIVYTDSHDNEIVPVDMKFTEAHESVHLLDDMWRKRV